MIKVLLRMVTMKSTKKVVIVVFALLSIFVERESLAVEEKTNRELMILFTHDLHSYFLPHRVLTAEGKHLQQGGYARLAYLIREQRILHRNKTLLLDSGDFSMGTLFHTSFMEEASELRLMAKMGYDAITLGNHDFDFHADGLAKALQSAKVKSKKQPLIVASNVIFSRDDPRDASLKQAFKDYPVGEYAVIERNGIRVGLFGMLGRSAQDDAPFVKPLTFADPVETGKRMVNILKDKADIIICLSHGGTSPNKRKSEDEILAREVPEIDIIISGHTHTILPQPILSGKTIIVSAGSYGAYLGMLNISYRKGDGVKLNSYELKNITADVPEDKMIAAEITAYKKIVERNFLARHGLTYDRVIVESSFDMESLAFAYQNPREMGLGNLITDAYRAAIKKIEGKESEHVSFAVQPLGHIRGSFLRGKITVADVFEVLSLGIGADGHAGYPLVAFYISGRELKDVLEVHTTVAPLIKKDAYLQVSGVRFSYNPNRMVFDRVTEVRVENESGEYEKLDYGKLYRACANLYTVQMVNYVVRVSHGVLNVQPKDKNGRALTDIKSAIIHLDKKSPQPEQLKEWLALVEYMRSFPDKDANGVADLPQKYGRPEGRSQIDPSWNPVKLIAGGNVLTYGALAIVLTMLSLVIFIIRFAVKRVRQIKASKTLR